LRPSNTGLTRIERRRLLDYLRVNFSGCLGECPCLQTCQLLPLPETICWCRRRASSLCSLLGQVPGSALLIGGLRRTEGRGSGSTPYELLNACLAACSVMTHSRVCARVFRSSAFRSSAKHRPWSARHYEPVVRHYSMLSATT